MAFLGRPSGGDSPFAIGDRAMRDTSSPQPPSQRNPTPRQQQSPMPGGQGFMATPSPYGSASDEARRRYEERYAKKRAEDAAKAAGGTGEDAGAAPSQQQQPPAQQHQAPPPQQRPAQQIQHGGYQQPGYPQQQQQQHQPQGYQNAAPPPRQQYASPPLHQHGFDPRQQQGYPSQQQQQQQQPQQGYAQRPPSAQRHSQSAQGGYQSPPPTQQQQGPPPQQQQRWSGQGGQQWNHAGPAQPQHQQQQWQQHPPAQSPPPPVGAVDHELQAMFAQFDSSRSGQLSAYDLVRLLAKDATMDAREDCVKMLMNIFDTDRSGSINFMEFEGLYRYIQDWHGIFRRFDRDNSGLIDRKELHNALLGFGFSLPKDMVSKLEKRFAPPPSGNDRQARGISFDRFLMACVTVKHYTEAFRRIDARGEGRITVDYNQFMEIVMDAPS
ncbi:hypothetical protein IAU60_004303 [Kwoniella sp. DSM 27419]